jgi:hypothetical protein
LAHDNSTETWTIDEINPQTSSGDKHPIALILSSRCPVNPEIQPLDIGQSQNLHGLYSASKQRMIDLVVTFNVPIDSQDGNAVDVTEQQKAEADFKEFVDSLAIKDFDLFA